MMDIEFFIVDYDDVDVDDIWKDWNMITDSFPCTASIYHTGTKDNCHMVVELLEPQDFDDVIEVLEDTEIDREYLGMVKDKRKFFERIDILRKAGLI